MLLNSEKLVDNFVPDTESSESSDFTDVADSDDASSSGNSSSEADEHTSNHENSNCSMIHDATIASTSGQSLMLNEDEEEDEIVKAIIRSKELRRIHPPPITMDDFVVDICFHPKENILSVANIIGDVFLYKYNNEEIERVTTLELHLKACRDIEFSNDGKILFSTAKDLCIMLTDVETEKLVRLYENAHEQPVYTLTVINENTFATGDDNGIVKLWDLRQKESKSICSFKEMEDYVSAMITNSDNKYLVCTSGDGSLTTFNMTARKLHVQSEEYEEELLCLGLFKSESKLLAVSSKGKMYVFNWGEFGLHSDEFPSFTKKALNCMIPITETIVITGGEDGILRGTSLYPHRHLGVVGQHNFSIEALDVNTDGTLIASSSHDNDIKFWNVEYFESLNTLETKRGQKRKQLMHNLPSSKMDNASDFFADL